MEQKSSDQRESWVIFSLRGIENERNEKRSIHTETGRMRGGPVLAPLAKAATSRAALHVREGALPH